MRPRGRSPFLGLAAVVGPSSCALAGAGCRSCLATIAAACCSALCCCCSILCCSWLLSIPMSPVSGGPESDEGTAPVPLPPLNAFLAAADPMPSSPLTSTAAGAVSANDLDRPGRLLVRTRPAAPTEAPLPTAQSLAPRN